MTTMHQYKDIHYGRIIALLVQRFNSQPHIFFVSFSKEFLLRFSLYFCGREKKAALAACIIYDFNRRKKRLHLKGKIELSFAAVPFLPTRRLMMMQIETNKSFLLYARHPILQEEKIHAVV